LQIQPWEMAWWRIVRVLYLPPTQQKCSVRCLWRSVSHLTTT
jgi:hypothetical protein